MQITLACGRYDRVQPLIDGRVRPEGVELNFIPMKPGETFWRQLNNGEFDASEISLSSYTILRSEGDDRFIAIPVFPSRVFRHSAVYLKEGSPIQCAADLKGKRVGLGDYQMTAGVYVRGFLKDEYGVRPEDIQWVVGQPIRPIKPPEGIRLEFIPKGEVMEEKLERGEIDALVSVMLPRNLGRGVRRLFRDFRQVEADYYRKTRIFPIMHTLALKRSVYEKDPWLAISLYKAFLSARDLSFKWLYNTDALPVSLPWVIDDIEKTREVFGPQIWDYSIEGSRPTLEALVRYVDEQKLSRRRMKVEELFAPNISPGLDHYLKATGED
jgi:4,5-dihydroxyphthalate decarboxylase